MRVASGEMIWPCAAVPFAELGPRTTLEVGGAAEWLLEPATPEEFVAACAAARERGFEPRVLGGGANLLLPDGLIAGVVVTTARMTRVFRPQAGAAEEAAEFKPELPALRVLERGEDARLVAWAGAPMPGLVRIARDLGWSGLEGLAGVPGQLGGGVAMNAGGRWGELWDVVERVRLLTRAGELVERTKDECRPRYRDGNLDGAFVLGAVLALKVDERAAVKERVADYLRQKSAAQPVTEHSCGCVFKNPPREKSGGLGAGQLIEQAGAKGLARGDAIVSEKHGNFIVNRGRARAADVFALIAEVRARVAEKTGIELELEVKVWDGAGGPGGPSGPLAPESRSGA
jgi:UDP-N-acetylmuramate dehydrogenase